MKCRVCAGFMPQSHRGRPRETCSTRCRNWRSTHGTETPRWLTERSCLYCRAPIGTEADLRLKHCSPQCARRSAAGSTVGLTKACSGCPDWFIAGNSKQIFCTPKCRARYHRRHAAAAELRRSAVKRGAKVDGLFTVEDLARRDGWVCALCIGPIDPLDTDRIWAATVDHVTPLSNGGVHSIANAQLAHWSCNAAKRNSINVITMSVPSDRPRTIIRAAA